MRLTESAKEKALPRIRRIEGQIQGLRKMIEEERYCIDVVQQITAARRALESLALVILDSHIREHLVHAIQSEDPKERDYRIQELMDVLNRFLK